MKRIMALLYSIRCNGVLSVVRILEHMTLTEFQDDEAYVGGFGETQLQLLHLNTNSFR